MPQTGHTLFIDIKYNKEERVFDSESTFFLCVSACSIRIEVNDTPLYVKYVVYNVSCS